MAIIVRFVLGQFAVGTEDTGTMSGFTGNLPGFLQPSGGISALDELANLQIQGNSSLNPVDNDDADLGNKQAAPSFPSCNQPPLSRPTTHPPIFTIQIYQTCSLTTLVKVTTATTKPSFQNFSIVYTTHMGNMIRSYLSTKSQQG